MAITGSKRQIKKNLLKTFDQTYDMDLYDYAGRSKRARGEAVLRAVVIAATIYMAGFGLAYYGWNTGKVHEDTLARFSWILMVPASAFGAFTFLFAMNRRLALISRDILDHAQAAEHHEGCLWRFAPLLEELRPGDEGLRRVVELSRTGALQQAEPEDYCAALVQIREGLGSAQTFSTATAQRLAQNFGWEDDD